MTARQVVIIGALVALTGCGGAGSDVGDDTVVDDAVPAGESPEAEPEPGVEREAAATTDADRGVATTDRTDETATGDTTPDDTAQDDTATDDTGPDDTAQDDTATDDTGPDSVVTEDPGIGSELGLATLELLTAADGGGTRPLLEWVAVDGAARYHVVVLAPNGSTYWAWRTSDTSVPVGGLPTLEADAAGPSIVDGMTWSVLAIDADGVPLAVSGSRPIAP